MTIPGAIPRFFLFWVLTCFAAFGEEAKVKTIAFDYSELYESLNPSIVKIHVDSGSGSGFLVSTSGLIATNHHVIGNSRAIAVQFADTRKVKAAIVVVNPRYDLGNYKQRLTVLPPPVILLPSQGAIVEPLSSVVPRV